MIFDLIVIPTQFIEYFSCPDKAIESLNRSERVLQHFTKDIPTDCEASKQCLREIEDTANEISQQLTR